ncbi:MAG TPA: protein kinase, partial [Polyangiaceae bacterium]|nr:protein kinase [Polyangiaceae bacterium]
MTPLTKVCSACGQRYDDDVIFCPKDGTPLSGRKTQGLDDPYVGIRLADQLSLQQLIGIGAMGRVYRAHQRGIDRDVAVKILHRELLRNPTVKARFLREAKVASRLSHSNVVQVLMTGEVEKHSADIGGEAYLVMEYLDGISLRSAFGAEGGSLPLPRAVHVMLQVCDAVGEGHSQGVVHRDLKPENVMLVRRGDDPDFVKVLDFGVARIDWADNTVATQAGVIFGTARYISPEGAQGKQVTAASDVYS